MMMVLSALLQVFHVYIYTVTSCTVLTPAWPWCAPGAGQFLGVSIHSLASCMQSAYSVFNQASTVLCLNSIMTPLSKMHRY